MNTNDVRTKQQGRALASVLLFALIGCSSVSHSNVGNNNQPANSNQPGNTAMQDQKNNPASDTVDTRLVSANTKFGLKLFAEIAKQDAGNGDDNQQKRAEGEDGIVGKRRAEPSTAVA